MNTYAIADGDKVEKYHIALLFDASSTDTPEWKQLAKATSNSISLNAETEDLDFIVDKSPTTIIKRYKPSLSSQSLTLYKGEDDYDFFFPKFYNLPTGADANGKMLIVFMNESTTVSSTTKFDAWLCDVTYVLETLDPVNSSLTFTVNINGTITQGKVEVDSSGDPTFTANS